MNEKGPQLNATNHLNEGISRLWGWHSLHDEDVDCIHEDQDQRLPPAHKHKVIHYLKNIQVIYLYIEAATENITTHQHTFSS